MSQYISSLPEEDFLVQALRDAVKSKLDKIVKAEVDKAMLAVQEQVPQVVAGLALELHKWIDIKTSGMGQHIAIDVRLNPEK